MKITICDRCERQARIFGVDQFVERNGDDVCIICAVQESEHVSRDQAVELLVSHFNSTLVKLSEDFRYHISGRVVGVCCSPWSCTRVHSSSREELEEIIAASYPVHEPNRSSGEMEVNQVMRSMGLDTVCNTRQIIPPKELDIYIPELRIAIEFNGNYYHSAAVMGCDPAEYHSGKVGACKELGIDLVFVWESDWKTSRDEVIAALSAFVTKHERSPILEKLVMDDVD